MKHVVSASSLEPIDVLNCHFSKITKRKAFSALVSKYSRMFRSVRSTNLENIFKKNLKLFKGVRAGKQASKASPILSNFHYNLIEVSISPPKLTIFSSTKIP